MRFFLFLLLFVRAPEAQQALPDAKLTPGVVTLETSAQLCDPSFHTGTVRNVSLSERKAVFKEYGVPWSDRRFYECDHLVSLEIGGSNNIKNIFPEPWHLKVRGLDEGAKIKDDLENKLHALVCSGKITLKQAQSEIAKDWVKSYRAHISSLPKYVGEGTIQDIHRVAKP